MKGEVNDVCVKGLGWIIAGKLLTPIRPPSV